MLYVANTYVQNPSKAGSVYANEADAINEELQRYMTAGTPFACDMKIFQSRTCCLRSLHCQRLHLRTLSESYI